MKIDLFSVNDKNGLDRVYMLLNSIKMTKQEQTVINYHLLIEDVDCEIKDYFADLVAEDFNIQFVDCRQFEDKIHLPKNGKYYAKVNYYTMVRCLCPSYFKQIDKMLYLDTDLVFLQHGIEQLWQTDIDQYYIAGVEDIIITRYKQCQIELKNLKQPEKYVNGGILLFNYKLIREDKINEKLVDWCMNWKLDQIQPFYLDQTLLNHLCREKIKYVDYKYNDISLVTSIFTFPSHIQYLREKYGYKEPVNSIQNAVILHFLGDAKPWKNFDADKAKNVFPYFIVSQKIWNHLKKVLQKGSNL